jgi:hypothetical protein
MGAIVIQSDDSLMKLFIALAKKTGAKAYKISNETLEDLEDLEDVRLFDEAKKNDDGVRIPMEEVFRKIEENRSKLK